MRKVRMVCGQEVPKERRGEEAGEAVWEWEKDGQLRGKVQGSAPAGWEGCLAWR